MTGPTPPRAGAPALHASAARTLHIGLRVGDPHRALTFYEALGYQVVGHVPQTPLGSLWMLKLPGDPYVTLELVHDEASGPVSHGGFSHLVIQVDDLQAYTATLMRLGLDPEPPSTPDGSDGLRTCMITDPDGYQIELVQWPPGHPDGMSSSDFDPGTGP